MLFDHYLVGAHDSSSVELHQSSVLNSPVVALLYPGTAFWPYDENGDVPDLTDGDGTVIGYATHVTYLHEETNTLKDGWLHVIDDADPPLDVSNNPVKSIHLPGRVKSGGTAIDHVELTADEVNLRTAPDGEVIYTLSRSDADADMITYNGITLPGKTGDWHYVSVGAGFFEDLVQTGYISADLSRLFTFRLEAELELDGVTCAALRYSESSALGAAEQTITGERLDMLLERLRSAYSQGTDAEVCAEGAAQITLTYEDGHTIALPLSGDSCTQVRYENVVYDLRTDAERTEHFLNDGGVNLADILSPLFDQIKFP